MNKTLSDLGERRLLSEVIPHYATGVGDDCAEVSIEKGTLVVTTDPVPPPAAASIGGDADPYWMGWLLVTINASDVAAAGGKPRAFLAALDLPRDMEVSAAERLLSGIRDACVAHDLLYIGGNLREASKLAATGTAFGDCVGYNALNRRGAQAGDLVLSVGQGGQFWSDALHCLDGGSVYKDESPLFKPFAQVKLMWKLASRSLATASMDTSDGLLPTLIEIAQKSLCTIQLDVERLTGHDDRGYGVRPWFGWGDWNVIITASKSNFSEISAIVSDNGGKLIVIGEALDGAPEVKVQDKGRWIAAPRLESERFASDSWFEKGVGEYARQLRDLQLP